MIIKCNENILTVNDAVLEEDFFEYIPTYTIGLEDDYSLFAKEEKDKKWKHMKNI